MQIRKCDGSLAAPSASGVAEMKRQKEANIEVAEEADEAAADPHGVLVP